MLVSSPHGETENERLLVTAKEAAECASVPFVRFCSANIEGCVLALCVDVFVSLLCGRACVAFGALERDTGRDGSIKGHTGDTLGHLQRLIW